MPAPLDDAGRRAFVARHTRLRHPPRVPELRLHLADEVIPLWEAVERELEATDAPPPFWAFAWAGGQALARYLFDHPAEVAGRRVLDVATGSGLGAIAARRCGAVSAVASDVDPFCAAAVALNAMANRVDVTFLEADPLGAVCPEVDVVLAGDVCYERRMAAHVLPWLRAAADRGVRVLIGDPWRAYLPREGLTRLAEYDVPTTVDLEGRTTTRAGVFTFGSGREVTGESRPVTGRPAGATGPGSRGSG